MSCEHKNVVKLSMHHSDCFVATFPDGSQYNGYADYDGSYGKTTNVHICLDCGQLVGGIDLEKLRGFALREMEGSRIREIVNDIMYSHMNLERVRWGQQEWYPPEGLDEPEHKDDLQFVQDLQSYIDDSEYVPMPEEIERLEAIQQRVNSFYAEEPLPGSFNPFDK